MNEIVNYFNAKNCTTIRTDFAIIKFDNAELVRDICLMDQQQKQLLAFFSFRYLDNNGLVEKV